MKSIIQEEKECFVCHSQRFLERHHVLFGKNHELSEKYGLTVWLCPYCHRGNTGVHHNRDLDLKLRRIAQEKFMEKHDIDTEEFILIFGRNYL